MGFGASSIGEIAKNIGGAFNVGLKAGIGDFAGVGRSLPVNMWTKGGKATLGGLSLAGAGAGAWYGSVSNTSPSTAQGAAIGAAAGTAALPLAGLAVAGGYHVANNIGKIGEAAFAAGRGAKWLGGGFAESLSSTNRFVNPLGSIANGVKKASNSLVRRAPVKDVWNAEKGIMESKGGNLKLSNWGKSLVSVTAVATGAFKAKEAFEQSRMGVQDNYITTSTPRIPSYKDDGGATGDLVFALNANRRG